MPDSYACPPIHFATINGHTAAVRTLLERGADPDARGRLGHVALMYAAQYNDVETLKLLLDFGATHWLPDVYHDCAQHYAMINRSVECLEILGEKRKIWYRAAFGCEEPEKDESMYVPPIELPCYFELRGTQGGPVFGNDMVYEDGRKAGDDGPAPSGPGSIGT
mmetsp:Transcript_3231/g.9908  ORF Transcript_3231/g.9908 Transcript_3231/m.9908 type:complete len:164 (-) Transcript_3231:29-520(-)